MSEIVQVAQLQARLEQSYARIHQAVERLDVAQLEQPGVQNEWSVKDILAHLTFWQQRMNEVLAALLNGQPPVLLRQPGEDGDTAVNRVNAAHYAANKDRPLADIQADFAQAYAQGLAAIGRLRDADLTDESAMNALLGGAVLELIAGNSYDHYDEHVPLIAALSD